MNGWLTPSLSLVFSVLFPPPLILQVPVSLVDTRCQTFRALYSDVLTLAIILIQTSAFSVIIMVIDITLNHPFISQLLEALVTLAYTHGNMTALYYLCRRHRALVDGFLTRRLNFWLKPHTWIINHTTTQGWSILPFPSSSLANSVRTHLSFLPLTSCTSSSVGELQVGGGGRA